MLLKLVVVEEREERRESER